jgi:hypothetical protein
MAILPADLNLLNPRTIKSLPFLNAAERMVDVLLDPATGLPEGDLLNRELAQETEAALDALAKRLGIDRKGKFTEEKRALEKLRCDLVSSIRRAARGILAEPEGLVSAEKRAAAGIVREVFVPRTTGFADLATADKNGVLRLLFEDCAAPEVQTALEQSGVRPHFDMLQQTHQAFENLSKQEIRAEVEAKASASDATGAETAAPGGKLPDGSASSLSTRSTRELKELASESLWLIFATASRHAAKDREPYGYLLAQCSLIAQEVNKVAKGRATRAKKAREKNDAKPAGASKPAPASSATTGASNGTAAPATDTDSRADAPSQAPAAAPAAGAAPHPSLAG